VLESSRLRIGSVPTYDVNDLDSPANRDVVDIPLLAILFILVLFLEGTLCIVNSLI